MPYRIAMLLIFSSVLLWEMDNLSACRSIAWLSCGSISPVSCSQINILRQVLEKEAKGGTAKGRGREHSMSE